MEREPNKEYWKGKEVSDYERKQRLLVPRKDEILDTIVDFIPFDEDQDIHVLDVGAGQGALSGRVLARFTNAHLTLYDSSEEMLSVAEQQLAEHTARVSTVVGDFNVEDWHAAVNKPVDAVISSIALQYLRTERRESFFQSISGLLSTPGCFLNGGAFNVEHPFIQQRGTERMLEHTQRQLLETEGKDVPIEMLQENMRKESEKAGVNRILLQGQCGLLEQAGFAHVEVVWRYALMAVVGAYKE
jgi:tRNA (cmo5U34)-methyltransferase